MDGADDVVAPVARPDFIRPHSTVWHYSGMRETLRASGSPPPQRKISTAVAALCGVAVVVFWALPTTLYCWEGAYNASGGKPPNWSFVALLVILGLLPWAFAIGYFFAMRKRQPMGSTLTFTTTVLGLVSAAVLFMRLTLSAPVF